MRLLTTCVGTILVMTLVVACGEARSATPAAPPVVTATGDASAASSPAVVTTGPLPVLTPPTPTPSPATKAPDTCGAPANTLGLNFCRRGHLVNPPAPAGTCTVFECIPNFDNGKGYLEECKDGKVSMSGGKQGACSKHNGEKQPIYQE